MELDKSYLFMTVTHYFTGKIVVISPTEITLNTCAWIPDTGRLNECIANGTFAECEPVGDGVVIPRNGTFAFPWKHKLPTAVK
jgi:hypothetical protein